MTNPTPSEITDNLDDFSQFLFSGKAVLEDKQEETLEDDPETLGDDTTAEEDVSSEDTQETPEPSPKKKKTVQDRIDEVVRQREEVAREAAKRESVLEAKLNEALERLSSVEKREAPSTEVAKEEAPSPDAVDENGNPIYALGQFDPEFQADWMKFQFDQRMKEQEQVQQAKTEEQKAIDAANAARATLQASWDEKIAAVKEHLPDIEEKSYALEPVMASYEPGYTQYLANAIMQMEHGPEVLYYLSTNTDEAAAIAAKGPVGATIELGKLEAQLASKARPTIKESTAPEPPVQLRGKGGKFSVPGDTDDLDRFTQEFYSAR